MTDTTAPQTADHREWATLAIVTHQEFAADRQAAMDWAGDRPHMMVVSREPGCEWQPAMVRVTPPLAVAVTSFVKVWDADGILIEDIAAHLQCVEAVVLAEVFRAADKPETARHVLEAHTKTDKECGGHPVDGGDPLLRSCEGCGAEPLEACHFHCLSRVEA